MKKDMSSVVEQPNFEELDRELQNMHSTLSKQIDRRCNEIANEVREKEDIPFTEWSSRIQIPLDAIRKKMHSANNYIFNHATSFSFFTSRQEQLQAKQDAIQAYEAIQTMISDQNNTIDKGNINLLNIHNHYVLMGALFLVAAFVLFPQGFVISYFFFGAVSASIIPDIAVIIGACALSFAFVGSVMSGTGCFLAAITKFGEKRNEEIIHETLSNKMSSFFHTKADILLSVKDQAPVQSLQLSTS